MGLHLNFAWMFAAVAIACIWLRLGRRSPESWHMQFVGLILVIVILLPRIVVTGHRSSTHSPGETKTFQFREQCAAGSHSAFMAIPVLLERATAELSFDSHPFGALLHAPFLAFDNPSLDSIQNRPPPWA